MNLDDLTSQTIFQQSPISTQIFSPTGESLMANKAWEKLWSIKHDQILGYNVLKDKQLVKKGVMKYIKKGFAGEIVQIPAIKYEPQKTVKIKNVIPYRWVKALIYPVKNGQGKIKQVVLQHEDVSSQVDFDEKIQESEIRYKTLTQLAPVGIFQTDIAGNCVYVNDRWCEYAGMTSEQAKGRGWVKALHPKDKDRIFKEWYKAAKKKKEFVSEYRFKKANGVITWLRGNAVTIKDAKGRVVGYLGTIIDITERKNTQEALIAGEERLRLALEAGNIGVWDWDISQNQITWSENLFRMHGVAKEKFKGTFEEYKKLIHPDDRTLVLNQIKQAMDGKKPYQLEFRAFGPNKKIIWIATSAKILYGQNKSPIRMLGAAIEITRRKQLEKQKDEFIALASHELKTPLTSLKVFVQVLHRSFEQSPDKRTVLLLNKMNIQINKLTYLISDLLDVSRIEEGRLTFRNEFFDFNQLIREVVEEVQLTTEKHPIVMKLDRTQKVKLDRERYSQALINLLTNAIKYSPPEKKIIVSTRLNNKQLIVSVRDFGMGIPKNRQQYIFERFYRVDHEGASYPGLGLGLYIAKEIITRQGGEIEVKSQVGKGTTFSFTVSLGKHK